MPEKVYDMEQSCERIKELCSEKGISSVELAESLGISRQAVSSWFNPRRRKSPSIDHICEIAELLQVSIDEIMIRRERNGE